MQDLLANVDHIKFDLEIAVEQQHGAQPLPFPGMDSKCCAAGCYPLTTDSYPKMHCSWLCDLHLIMVILMVLFLCL